MGEGLLVVADLELSNLHELENLASSPGSPGLLLARLYQAEGPHFIKRLRGAFALAIWDPGREAAPLGRGPLRDQATVLHEHCGAYGLRDAARPADEASPASGRTSTSAVCTAISTSVSCRRLARSSPASCGFLRDTWASSAQTGRPSSRTGTWHTRNGPMRRTDAAATVYRLTEQAVADALRDISPKEMGAYLSGGTDSSTVVGLAARLTGERVQAFSVGFSEETIRRAGVCEDHGASLRGGPLHRILGPDEALAGLPRLVEAYDEPSGNNSAIGALACAEAARECGVRRLLAGDGGDEIFGGNERYRTDRIFARYGRVPAIVRRALLEPALSRVPEESLSLSRPGPSLRPAREPAKSRAVLLLRVPLRSRCRRAPGEDVSDAVSKRDPYAILDTHYRQARATAELNRLMYIDLKVTLGDNDLLKVTRTAELAGVAVRFPFLSLPLVEFTGTMPARFQAPGTREAVSVQAGVRDAACPRDPRQAEARVRRADQRVAEGTPGFKELARDTLLSARARQRGYLRREPSSGCSSDTRRTGRRTTVTSSGMS